MSRGSRKREQDASERHSGAAGIPAQEDEADILEEVGGERDEGGELMVDEASVVAVGAVDADSVRTNRRMDAVVKKKRGGEKHVTFNTDDLLTMYESLIKVWAPNTLDISVRRMTGSAVTRVITSRPRSGVELYEAIRAMHGLCEESEYEVKFLDTNRKMYRGTGRITMPDTRVTSPQGQSPMYPPNGAPLGYPPPQTYPPQQVPQAAPVGAPPGSDPMAMMHQMFQLFQQMQASVQPQSPFQAPQMPATAPVSSPQVGPMDPMAMMNQMFQMFQQMQGQQPVHAAPQPVAAPAPAPSPPGGIDQLAMLERCFELFQKMQPPPAPVSRGPFQRDPRAPYYPQGERAGGPERTGAPQQHQPPQRPPSMVEQFRESIGIVRTARSMLDEMEGLMPGSSQEAPTVSGLGDDDEDSPIKIIDTGAGKIVVNKHDGGMRLWESGFANLPDILKWGGEQIQKINKTNSERQLQQQQPRQQLPPGYVEVHPGYRPPPGYVAVAVDQEQPQQEERLPPPPTNLPPPIHSSPSREAWGEPVITDQVENE